MNLHNELGHSELVGHDEGRFHKCRFDRSFHFNFQPAIPVPALKDWLGIRRRGEARPRSPFRSC